jgi:hypothetical protein
MLALPLNKPEPAIPFSPPPPLPELPAASPRPAPAANWRADTPTPSAKQPYYAPEPADESVFTPAFLPEPAVAAKPVRTEPTARVYTPAAPTEDVPPTGGPGTLRGVDAPALPMGYTPPEPLPPLEESDIPSAFAGMSFAEVNPFAEPLSQAQEPEPTTSSPPVPFALWPVFAVNAVIEYLLGWFGPLGHWLTRPWMKTILGWSGLLLLLGAGYWAARGQGWVSWPR